jgi:hypothetical protein
VHKRIIRTVKRVKFVSDRMSHVILRGRWFLIIILNGRARTEDEIDEVKTNFCKELECVIDKFSNSI